MTRFALASFASLIAVASFSQAAVTTYTATTLDNSNPNGIGYDPDAPAPTVTDSGFHAAGTVGQYNSVRFTPDAIGMTGLTLGDITGVSYHATNAVAGTQDWQFKVYTVTPTGDVGWYGVRVEAAITTSGTTPTDHTLTNYYRITGGSNPNTLNYYANNDGSLPTNFSNLLASAANEKVLFFDISAGANNGGYAYDTTLNDVTISGGSTFGTSVVTTPEPASLALVGIGGAALLMRRRRTIA